MFLRILPALAGLICASSLISAAGASSLQVNPIRMDFSPDAKSATLTLTNNSPTQDTVMQARAYKWSQVDGKDELVPTNEIIVNPPIFTVKAASKQIVRIGLRKLVEGPIEQTFRLVLTEAPPPATAEPTRGLQMMLNFSLPIFIAPKPVNAQPPMWRVRMSSDGQLRLMAENPGNTHLRVNSLALRDGNSEPLASVPQQRYLLAGSKVEWTLPARRTPAAKVRVVASMEAGDVDVEVPVERP